MSRSVLYALMLAVTVSAGLAACTGSIQPNAGYMPNGNGAR